MALHRIGFSEGKACDAIIRLLEAQKGVVRENLSSPEATKAGAPVELVFSLAGILYALEHTGIEPFDRHVELTARIVRDLVPVQKMISDAADLKEHVLIEIPMDELLSVKKQQVKQFQETLTSWVLEALPETVIAKMGRYPSPNKPYSVPGIDFPVWLHRMETMGHPPFVKVSAQIEDFDRAGERISRIEKACTAKFPKLAAWKKSNGARTVLVLEDNDIQFTSQGAVAEALQVVIESLGDVPDEIWLVISCTEPWIVFPMLIDGRSYFELSPEMRMFNSCDLQSLTAR